MNTTKKEMIRTLKEVGYRVAITNRPGSYCRVEADGVTYSVSYDRLRGWLLSFSWMPSRDCGTGELIGEYSTLESLIEAIERKPKVTICSKYGKKPYNTLEEAIENEKILKWRILP